jgi:ATP cone domain.
MRVTKRNGGQEIVDVNKIVKAVTRSADGLHAVDPLRVALKTIGGLYDGATTAELDQLSIRTAAASTAEEPEYGQLAARLLGAYIDKEVSGQEIQSFSQSMRAAPNWASSTTACAISSRPTRASSTMRSIRWPRAASSTSACAPCTTATCCAIRSNGW